jgi:Mg-chelatase subunit ChlD
MNPKNSISACKILVLFLMIGLMATAAAAAANPPLSSSCGGIDIALIIDNSGSISSTELTTMKNAFSGFVDAAMPSISAQMAVVKFNTNGDLVLDYSSDSAAVKNAINSVSTSSGYTNWQDGLKEAKDEFDNSARPDLYVFTSDGNPNRYGDPSQGHGSTIDINALNAAITTADLIKNHTRSGRQLKFIQPDSNLKL